MRLYRIVCWLASFFGGRVLVPLFTLVKDRKTPELIGVTQPELFERILMKLIPYRDITKDSIVGPSLYLRRFFLTPRMWPVRIFLHHIARSDDDRDMHDHPWPYSSTILKGSYCEELPGGHRLALPGSTNSVPAEHVHRVSIIEPVWSLVVTMRAQRVWGFIVDGKHVPWFEYLKGKGEEPAPEDKLRAA